MILVADSGSTKTDWRFFQEDKIQSIETLGVNPMIHNEEYIRNAFFLNNDFINLKNIVKYIFFYGAGCSSSDRNEKVRKVLLQYFEDADIVVEHDMLAALIALHGDADGIACIMGTGSNSVLQKNKQLIEVLPSLGYILGDEAGGVDFGKRFLRDFLYKRLPKEINDYAIDELQLNKESVLNSVYKSPPSNKYMASFVPVLLRYRASDYVQQLLNERFSAFFDFHILCYENYLDYPIGCIGTIANIFSDELQLVAQNYDTKIDIFIQKPIDALMTYHIRKIYA